MRNLFAIAFLLFFTACLNQRPPIQPYIHQYEVVDEPLSPPEQKEDMASNMCGTDAQIDRNQWKLYLEKNLQPDPTALDTIPPGQYKMSVRFIIDEKGNISFAEVVNDPGYGLGSRAKQVILNYPGTWKPAQYHGRAIKSHRTQPVTIVIEEEEIIPECDDPVLSPNNI
jgi:hypothetical protein